MKNLAQINLAPDGGYKGFGPLGEVEGNGIDTFANFLSSAIGLMTIIAIVWFIFVFITGAIGIVSSGGDKGALESSKKKISTGLIGLVVVIIATFVLDLFGYLLGFDSGAGGILNLNNLFNTLIGGGQVGGGAGNGP